MKKSRKFILKMAVFAAIFFGVCSFMVFRQYRASDQSIDESQMDSGLIWFGLNGVFQKTNTGKPNRYFDPAQPTIIFIHGWMPDQVGEPPTFMVDFPDPEQNATYTLDVAASWVDAGWNIGIFYWHPFSDEEFVWDAEDKIWTADAEVGMRYRDVGGNYHSEAAPTVSVSQLLLDAYLEAMKDYAGPEIRIAGHSLGNQLAVNLTSDLVEKANAGTISPKLIPTRVALLDPFWSPFPKPYLNELETGEVVQQKIEQVILPQNVVVEWYRSSLLTESTMIRDEIPELKTQVLYAELEPRYCDFLDQVCKHDGAWHRYFLSYGSSAPPECIPDEFTETCEPTGEYGPSASTDNQRIAEMMTSPYYWVQDVGPDNLDGRFTPQTDDDWFYRLPLSKVE